MDDLVELLIGLLDIDGINTALMVSKDGLAIEGISCTVVIDTEEIGVTITNGLKLAEQIGRSNHLGELLQMTIENRGGITMISSIGDFAILVITADLDANVGVIRHSIKKASLVLEKAL